MDESIFISMFLVVLTIGKISGILEIKDSSGIKGIVSISRSCLFKEVDSSCIFNILFGFG